MFYLGMAALFGGFTMASQWAAGTGPFSFATPKEALFYWLFILVTTVMGAMTGVIAKFADAKNNYQKVTEVLKHFSAFETLEIKVQESLIAYAKAVQAADNERRTFQDMGLANYKVARPAIRDFDYDSIKAHLDETFSRAQDDFTSLYDVAVEAKDLLGLGLAGRDWKTYCEMTRTHAA